MCGAMPEPSSSQVPPSGDRWKHRRRLVYAALIYCAAMVAWLGVVAEPSSLREQLALALVALAGAVIGAYVFGAAWDDKNMLKGGRQ